MPKKLNKPRVLGVLAGGDFPLENLAAWAKSADIILAADGAADRLFAVGILPHATIGDLDSISNSTKDRQIELIHVVDQNFSDCDKLLTLAEERGWSHITLAGLEGDLIDHLLGALYSAARSPLTVRMALRRGICRLLHGPDEEALEVPDRTRLSLMPVGPCTGVTLEGTEWSLTEADLSPLGMTSLSNRASGHVRVQIREGAAALFLSHPELELPHWTLPAEPT